MQIKTSIVSITLLAGLSLSSIGAHAQAVNVRVGGSVGGLGSSLGSGVGSLASVGVGSLGASVSGGGSLANVAVGSTNATILPTANAGGTTSLNTQNFFSANHTKAVAGFGDGLALTNTSAGSGGGGTQFGANGSVEAQAARKRIVSTERMRKLKRRMSQISIAN